MQDGTPDPWELGEDDYADVLARMDAELAGGPMGPLGVSTGEYGSTATGAPFLPPPPPPPPPVQRVGETGAAPFGELAQAPPMAPLPGAGPELAAPPELAPDAITGADPILPSELQPGTGVPVATFDAAMRDGAAEYGSEHLFNPPDVAEPAGNLFDLPSVDEQVDALHKLSPEDRARVEIMREATRRNQEVIDAHAISQKDRERAEIDHAAAVKAEETRHTEADAIRGEAKKLATEKVDPDGWMKSRSVPQTIAAFIAAVVGGLVQSRGGPGARNTGLDMINQSIEQHIDAQKANLAAKRAALGDRRAALGELRQTDADFERKASAYRVATYEAAMHDLATRQMQYDPNGTTSLAIDRSRRMLGAEQAKYLAQSVEVAAKKAAEDERRRLEIIKVNQEAAKIDETARSNKADERNAAYGISSTANTAQKRLEFDDKKLAADVKKDDLAAAKLADVEGRELGGLGDLKVARDGNGAPIMVADPKTGQMKPKATYGDLLNGDGKPWRAPSKEVAIDLATKRASAENVVEMIDEVIAIRDRTGGESTTLNSDDSQRLLVLEANILEQKKLGTNGMSSDGDMDVLRQSAGAKDLTSFRAKAAGLEKARERVLASMNKSYKIVGKYTGRTIAVENKFAEAPANTAAETKLKEIQKRPQVSVDEADRQATIIVKAGYDMKELERDPALQKKFIAEVAALKADYKEISPNQRRDIHKAGDVAGGSGEAADKALADLRSISTTGQTEAIRSAAAAAVASAELTRAGSK